MRNVPSTPSKYRPRTDPIGREIRLSYQSKEVDWYLRNGTYQDQRIKRDGAGDWYVVGDDNWNRFHPRNQEWVERLMRKALDEGEVIPGRLQTASGS